METTAVAATPIWTARPDLYGIVSQTLNSDPALSAIDVRILTAMYIRGLNSGECYASVETIARESATCTRTVKRRLPKLAELGYITIRPDKTKKTGRSIELTWLHDPNRHPQPKGTRVTACHPSSGSGTRVTASPSTRVTASPDGGDSVSPKHYVDVEKDKKHYPEGKNFASPLQRQRPEAEVSPVPASKPAAVRFDPPNANGGVKVMWRVEGIVGHVFLTEADAAQLRADLGELVDDPQAVKDAAQKASWRRAEREQKAYEESIRPTPSITRVSVALHPANRHRPFTAVWLFHPRDESCRSYGVTEGQHAEIKRRLPAPATQMPPADVEATVKAVLAEAPAAKAEDGTNHSIGMIHGEPAPAPEPKPEEGIITDNISNDQPAPQTVMQTVSEALAPKAPPVPVPVTPERARIVYDWLQKGEGTAYDMAKRHVTRELLDVMKTLSHEHKIFAEKWEAGLPVEVKKEPSFREKFDKEFASVQSAIAQLHSRGPKEAVDTFAKRMAWWFGDDHSHPYYCKIGHAIRSGVLNQIAFREAMEASRSPGVENPAAVFNAKLGPLPRRRRAV